jgi:hypothetical protein
MPTTDEDQVIEVVLTYQEIADLTRKALEQGLTTDEFAAYCIRALAFGIVYAVSMLPNQGQVGTQGES